MRVRVRAQRVSNETASEWVTLLCSGTTDRAPIKLVHRHRRPGAGAGGFEDAANGGCGYLYVYTCARESINFIRLSVRCGRRVCAKGKKSRLVICFLLVMCVGNIESALLFMGADDIRRHTECVDSDKGRIVIKTLSQDVHTNDTQLSASQCLPVEIYSICVVQVHYTTDNSGNNRPR